MAKTRRKTPTDNQRRAIEREEQFERQVQALQEKHSRVTSKPSTAAKVPSIPAQPRDRVTIPVPAQVPPPAEIETIHLEAEKLANEQIKAATASDNYSRQDPAAGQGTLGGSGLIWWTAGDMDTYIPLAEYGTQQRQYDLRAFALVAPLVLIAESVLIQKMKALQWSVEAGRNRAILWQRTLANLEQGQGWDTFIARWTRAYLESDYGGYAEIIRRAPAGMARVEQVEMEPGVVSTRTVLTAAGEAAMKAGRDRSWPIVDAKVMDPCQCVPSGDPEFPLHYYNPHTGKRHMLREHQFMKLLDMPSVDDRRPNQGVCATSRAVWAAQEDRMQVRYAFEALSENPGTGLIMANVNQTLLQTALESAKGERDARGVVYYKGLIFLPILDPSGTVKLEYLTFAHYPESFNRTEDYSRVKEIVASAFGLDVLELGSIPGHNLGTSAQAEVGAAKARGKGIGALIQGVEREFRHKFLPSDVQLRIKKHDVDELKDRAELDAVYFTNAVSMLSAGGWDPVLANQYLADRGAIEPEFPYLAADLTPSEELEDTEATNEKMLQAILVRVDKDGTVHYKAHPYVSYAQKQVSERPFDMREEISVRDMLRARALFSKHAPARYSDLTR